MCLWVEKAHLRELVSSANESVEAIRFKSSERAKDFLLQLPPGVAEAAIIFRDFPKRHGNIK